MRALSASVLLAAAALGLAGCGGAAKQPPAAQILAAATKATAAQKTFHFVFDEQHGPVSKSGLHLIFAEGDVAVPGKIRADVSGTFLGLPVRSRLIAVGGKDYFVNPLSQKWETINVRTSPLALFDPAKGVIAVIGGATQVQSLGSEKIAGEDAYHLQGKVPVSAITPILGNPPSAHLVDVELWISKKTSRLLRVRVSGPVESGDPANASRTVDLSRYGQAVVIKPPVAS